MLFLELVLRVTEDTASPALGCTAWTQGGLAGPGQAAERSGGPPARARSALRLCPSPPHRPGAPPCPERTKDTCLRPTLQHKTRCS